MSDVKDDLIARAAVHDKQSLGSIQALGYFSAYDAKLMMAAAKEIERLREEAFLNQQQGKET